MLRVSKAVLERTLAHLEAELPNEGVGLWAGRGNRVSQVIPLPNVHPEPRVAYQAEPAALIKAIQELEEGGLELLAIYHSHPTGSAQPSPSDQQQAYWRVPYVIFALQAGQVRAYKLPEGEEVNMVVEEIPPTPLTSWQ